MNSVALARLLRLASPALPIGAFSYSQGLEWAVDAGRVSDETSARRWIGSLLAGSMARFELPTVARFYAAWRESAATQAAKSGNDAGQAEQSNMVTGQVTILSTATTRAAMLNTDATHPARINDEYLASRETAELRAESVQMGRALRTVLVSDGELDQVALESFASIDSPAFPNSFAFAAVHWNLDLNDALTAYIWSWLENQVTAAIKLVPLGQSAGQRILVHLTPACANAVDTAVSLPSEDWSNFSPLFAIASSRHEKQYTRLFRS